MDWRELEAKVQRVCGHERARSQPTQYTLPEEVRSLISAKAGQTVSDLEMQRHRVLEETRQQITTEYKSKMEEAQSSANRVRAAAQEVQAKDVSIEQQALAKLRALQKERYDAFGRLRFFFGFCSPCVPA